MTWFHKLKAVSWRTVMAGVLDDVVRTYPYFLLAYVVLSLTAAKSVKYHDLIDWHAFAILVVSLGLVSAVWVARGFSSAVTLRGLKDWFRLLKKPATLVVGLFKTLRQKWGRPEWINLLLTVAVLGALIWANSEPILVLFSVFLLVIAVWMRHLRLVFATAVISLLLAAVAEWSQSFNPALMSSCAYLAMVACWLAFFRE